MDVMTRRRIMKCATTFVLVVLMVETVAILWMRYSNHTSLDSCIFYDSDGTIRRNVNAEEAISLQKGEGKPLGFEGPHGINLMVNGKHPGNRGSEIHMSEKKIELVADSVSVKTAAGDNILNLNKDEAVLGAQSLRLSSESEGNAVIQTGRISAPPKNDLNLEADAGSMYLYGSQGIILNSQVGGITSTSYKDQYIRAIGGAVVLSAEEMYFENLRVVKVGDKKNDVAMNVCLCNNSKSPRRRVFLSTSSLCIADTNDCL